jgi:hypothetical protein
MNPVDISYQAQQSSKPGHTFDWISMAGIAIIKSFKRCDYRLADHSDCQSRIQSFSQRGSQSFERTGS